MEHKHRITGANFWLAIALIAIGALFLLDNLYIVDIGNFWDYWPVLFIAVGLMKLTRSEYRDKTSAFMLIGFGVVFLLINFDVLEWRTIWQFWPVILIMIGLSIIFGRYRRQTGADTKESGSPASDDRIDAMAIFGGNERVVTSENFQGGNTTAIFGGTKLHFGRAKLSQGDNVLDVLAMFGGVEILVPDDWNIVIKLLPIFGGSEDSRRHLTQKETAKNKTLVIKGLVIFGGLHIKNA